MNSIIFEIDSGLDAVHARKTDWQVLYRNSGSSNPFLTWEWNYYWASSHSTSKNIRILIGKSSGVVSCIVPLQMEGRKMTFLRDHEYADYGGLLLSKNLSGHHLNTIIDRIMYEANCVAFEAIRSDSLEFCLIDSLVDAKRIQPVITYMCDNPYVAKGGDFDTYYKTRSKKLRQEIRTTENHLKRIGEYKFVEVIKGDYYEKLLDRLAEFHLKRQDGKIGASILGSKKALNFFKEAPVHLNSGNCQLHMSAIVVNDLVISAALSIQTNSTLYYWIPSFDPDIPKVSLGKLHIKLLIEKCYKQNMVFDFMGGDEKYKYQWADSSISVVKYMFFKSECRKALYRSGEYMKRLLKDRVSNNHLIRNARVAISNHYR